MCIRPIEVCCWCVSSFLPCTLSRHIASRDLKRLVPTLPHQRLWATYSCDGYVLFNNVVLFISLHRFVRYQIDDLETPYTNYCYKYCCGFDNWELVSSNTRLPSIIAAFSTALPPPTSLITSPDDPPLWTLDALFLLPKLRLKYYKKLYSRLLKSTVPGRSDHRLLVGALDKLDGLLDTLEQRAQIRVTSTQSPSNEPPILQSEDEVVFDLRTQRESAAHSPAPSAPVQSDADATPNSSSSSARGSSVLGYVHLIK